MLTLMERDGKFFFVRKFIKGLFKLFSVCLAVLYELVVGAEK